jgi:glycosyltransferase involved in cell wall biosynthesis
MRLLHIISSVDPRGGGPIEGIRQRGLVLQAQSHQVEVLSLDDASAAHVHAFPLPVHAVGPSYGGYGFCPGLAPWLRAHAMQYDHIIVHGLWQYHGACASRVLRRMGKPYCVFTHGMLDPWFRHTYPLKHLKKWAYWLLAEYGVLRHARKVFFTSEEERLRARQSFSLYQANEEVVPYGTATPPQDAHAHRQRFFADHPQLRGKHLLLFLSRIHPKKGCDLLIDAFAHVAAHHPEAHLVVAGPSDTETLGELERIAARLLLPDRITWLGMVKGDDKWAAFHACDAFVLPSHQENFGIAVAEALGCGKPVLISDKINIWREIAAARAGLVEPDTQEGTRALLTQWFVQPPEARAGMAQAAQAVFQQRYTVEAMATGLINALSRSD